MDNSDEVHYSSTGRISKVKKRLKVHNCECGRSYTRAEHLRRHRKNHTHALLCDYPGCGKPFYRIDLLERHKERHNESVPDIFQAEDSSCFAERSHAGLPAADMPYGNFQPDSSIWSTSYPTATSHSLSTRYATAPAPSLANFTPYQDNQSADEAIEHSLSPIYMNLEGGRSINDVSSSFRSSGFLAPHRIVDDVSEIPRSDDIGDSIKVEGIQPINNPPFVESNSTKDAVSQEVKDSIVPLASDSGYRSGLGTDTASVCSIDSIGTSLGLPTNFLQEFIAFFGDALIEKSGVRQWINYAVAHNTQEYIDNFTQQLLRKYTVDLSRERAKAVAQGDSSVSRDHVLSNANLLIRRYRPKITRYVRENAATSSVTAASLSEQLHALGQQLSLSERLGLFTKPSAIDRNIEDHEIEEDEIELELPVDLEAVRNVMISSEAFRSLASKLRQVFYCDDRSEMDRISIRLEGLMGSYQVHFDVDWDPASFMRTQYGEDCPSIGSVIVITGSALYAHATTCADYMAQIWPKTSSALLDCLDSIIGGATRKVFQYRGTDVIVAIQPRGTIEVRAMECRTNVAIELMQQLAWLGSALSISPFGEDVAHAKPKFFEGAKPAEGFMRYRLEPIHSTETACWLPLFSGAVIASGFPIPSREGEVGLEIPLEILAGIAGVRHAVEYEGGVVMKGFSHMLVPIRKTGDIIQWHAVSSRDPSERLSYRQGLSMCSERALLEEVNLDDINRCRAIVGWCTVAKTLLGSSSANYENIEYSGAEDASGSFRCAGGSLGFQQFGTAALDFRFGVKDGKCHFQRSGPYRNIVSAAEKTPVVLYDTGEKRAWLVPASNVILHMVQHKHRLEPFEINGQRIDLDTSINMDSSAKNVLMTLESLRLADDDNYRFRDAVLNIWSLLEFLIDQNITREKSTSGIPIKANFRELLSGFEFKAVVEERSPFRQKQTQLNKTTGGWPRLVRDIDALVLLANGFEDIIKPTKEGKANLCHAWKSVPKGKDYLAALTRSMEDLYDVAGCRYNRQYLTSTRLKWHQGDSILFTGCRQAELNCCKCDRLQQIHANSAMSTTTPPQSIAERGAVIFGNSGSSGNTFLRKRKENTAETEVFYNQDNLPITVTSTQQQSENDLLSDAETCLPSGSDGTNDSMQSSVTNCTTQSEPSIPPSVQKIATNVALEVRPKKRSWLPEFTSILAHKENATLITSSPKRARVVEASLLAFYPGNLVYASHHPHRWSTS